MLVDILVMIMSYAELVSEVDRGLVEQVVMLASLHSVPTEPADVLCHLNSLQE